MAKHNDGTEANTLVKEGLLDESEAADYLGLSPRTLQNWRVRGGGPDYVKLSGRMVCYRLVDLNDWVAESIQNSTSEDCDET